MKSTYFTPKFWPDKKYRKKCQVPYSDGYGEEEDENAEMRKMLLFRQGYRMYYNNWKPVYQTYLYLSWHILCLIPVVSMLCKSWGLRVVLLVTWLLCRGRMARNYWNLRMVNGLVTGLIDPKLAAYFGYIVAG